MIKIANEILSVEVAEKGAELMSLRRGDAEYIWQGDPQIWGRHAPILFPIVGKVYGGEYRVGERTFKMGQHGFARDLEWTVMEHDDQSVRLRLKADDATRERYPYEFQLDTLYHLEGNSLVKYDTVTNLGADTMYYQLGNHPGFYYRDFKADEHFHGYMALFCNQQQLDNLELSSLTEEGYVEEEGYNYGMPQGILPLSDALFSNDALVLEDSQVQQCVLLDKELKPYLSVIFPQAEVLGIWSPKGKQAPFVCIEPWNGRADRDGYAGDIAHRDWIQSLEPMQSRTTEMRIVVR